MNYYNFYGDSCVLSDFFDDYDAIGQLVILTNEKEEVEWTLTDFINYNGSVYAEFVDDDVNDPIYLSEEFFFSKNLTDFDDDVADLEQMFPKEVHNPCGYEAYVDYLIDMQRDKELFGW